jgi:hypothetical protein
MNGFHPETARMLAGQHAVDLQRAASKRRNRRGAPRTRHFLATIFVR